MTPAETRGDILRRTLKEMGVSHIELARRLVEGEVTAKTVGNKRRQVTGWIQPSGNFNDRTAERLTKALELPDDRLKAVVRRRRQSLVEKQVAAIAAIVVPLARERGLQIPEILLEDDERDP